MHMCPCFYLCLCFIPLLLYHERKSLHYILRYYNFAIANNYITIILITVVDVIII